MGKDARISLLTDILGYVSTAAAGGPNGIRVSGCRIRKPRGRLRLWPSSHVRPCNCRRRRQLRHQQQQQGDDGHTIAPRRQLHSVQRTPKTLRGHCTDGGGGSGRSSVGSSQRTVTALPISSPNAVAYPTPWRDANIIIMTFFHPPTHHSSAYCDPLRLVGGGLLFVLRSVYGMRDLQIYECLGVKIIPRMKS